MSNEHAAEFADRTIIRGVLSSVVRHYKSSDDGSVIARMDILTIAEQPKRVTIQLHEAEQSYLEDLEPGTVIAAEVFYGPTHEAVLGTEIITTVYEALKVLIQVTPECGEVVTSSMGGVVTSNTDRWYRNVAVAPRSDDGLGIEDEVTVYDGDDRILPENFPIEEIIFSGEFDDLEKPDDD